MDTLRPLSALRSQEQARAVLHPLRLAILREAREPLSATSIARRLGLPRQRVNYHVGELARAGLLRRAGRRRRRNLTEQRYVASARSYVLSPELLGPLEVDADTLAETASASRLMALASQLLSELGRVGAQAARERKRVATLSLDVPVRFDDPEQRSRFARELRDAIAAVVARHTAPVSGPDGTPRTGRPFRLVVGCYPVPAPSENEEIHDERPDPEA